MKLVVRVLYFVSWATILISRGFSGNILYLLTFRFKDAVRVANKVSEAFYNTRD